MTAPTPLPSKVNRAWAEAAVQEWLEDPNWQAKAQRRGWNVRSKDALTLLVTLRARPLAGPDDPGEQFTLRLICEYYPTHPPDVQFVNPSTAEYVVGRDACHLPILTAPNCRVHLTYSYQTGYPYGSQLVCNSLTLAYYFSGHNPTPDQIWKPGVHTIGSSIQVISNALYSPHYTGRQTA